MAPLTCFYRSLTFQPRSDPSETTTSAAKRKFLLRAMVHLINRCIGLRHISIDLREFSSVQVAFLKQQMSDIMLPSADFRTHGDVTHGSPFRWSECEYVSVDTALQCEILQQASACAKRIRRLAFVACFPSLGEMELCYGYNAALRAAVLPTSLDRRFPGLIIHMFPQVECVVINAFAADIAAGTSLLDFVSFPLSLQNQYLYAKGPLEILFLGALKQNWDGSKVKKLSVEIPLVYAFREVHRRHPSSEEQQQPMSNALWVWYEMLALRIVWVGVSLEEVCIRAAWPHYVRARINGWVERVTSRSRDCHSFPYGLLDPNDPEERASF